MVASGILISSLGALDKRSSEPAEYYIGVVSVFLLYLPVSLLQTKEYRNNISRFIFESPLLKFLGYLSYPLYIFQVVFIDFYYQIFIEDIRNHEFPVVKEELGTFANPFNWMRKEPIGIKIGGISLLIAFCYLIQKYYQDVWVASLFASFLAKN